MFLEDNQYLSGKERVVEEEKPQEEYADPLLLPVPLALRPTVRVESCRKGPQGDIQPIMPTQTVQQVLVKYKTMVR